MINKVAAYGCSFTEGQELPDEQFIKNAEKRKKKIGYQKFVDTYDSILTSKEYKNACKQLSWPKYVAEKLNVEYYNNAQGGSSLEDTVYKITQDIDKNILDRDTLILIGLTNVNRWMWPTIHNDQSFMVNFLSTKGSYKELTRSFLLVYSDAKMLHHYYCNLEYIELLSYRYQLNIKCWGMCEDFKKSLEHLKPQVTPQYFDYMCSRWEHLKSLDIFNWDTQLDSFVHNNTDKLGGGHFTKKVHIEFANYVYKSIKV